MRKEVIEWVFGQSGHLSEASLTYSMSCVELQTFRKRQEALSAAPFRVSANPSGDHKWGREKQQRKGVVVRERTWGV